MIKSKLRITPGSVLPYFSALLVLIAAAGYLLCWQTTASLFRFRTILDDNFVPMQTGELLQFAAMILLFVLILFAARESLPTLILPTLLYSVGTVLLTLDNHDVYYPLLVMSLGFFWFFAVTSLSFFHSKWPLCVSELICLAAVLAFCIMGKKPYLTEIDVPGMEGKTFVDISFLMRVVGYYGGMLILSLAIGKKYNMETVSQKGENDESAKTKDDTAVEGKPAEEIVEHVKATEPEKTGQSKPQGSAEPAVTVPVSGSRLQKVLKEEIVYDRDQRLMYKKKVNIFSVIGMILSVLTVAFGVIIIFQLVDIPALKNDSLGLPMLAMGLFMSCMFGTRMTYKEYYTKTIVTERKVMREETNWEEVLAGRLEEDEQSIALLSENYSRMTELYGKLLENTTELMKHVNLLGEYEQKLNLLEASLRTTGDFEETDEAESEESASDGENETKDFFGDAVTGSTYEDEEAGHEAAVTDIWEEQEEAGYEAAVTDTRKEQEEAGYEAAVTDTREEQEAAGYEAAVTDTREEQEAAGYEAAVTDIWEEHHREDYEEPVTEYGERLVAEAAGESGFVKDTAPRYVDLASQVSFDSSFLSEEAIEEALSVMETHKEEEDAELPSSVEITEDAGMESAPDPKKEEPAAVEPEIPSDDSEMMAVATPVPDPEERRKKLQEKILEIQRRNREKFSGLDDYQ